VRSRSAAQRAPKTDEQALAIAQRRAELDAQLDAREAERTATIAATNASVDAITVPIVAEIKDLDKQLKAWWPGAAGRLTGGKRKSIEFGGCIIGERTTPPKLTFSGGNDAAMVEAIVATGSKRLRTLLLRVKSSPEKAMFLKLLSIGDQLSARLRQLGFAAKQTEEFFVDRAPSGAVRPEVV
jgi:phage host-nuclease inhibitor protein Gam